MRCQTIHQTTNQPLVWKPILKFQLPQAGVIFILGGDALWHLCEWHIFGAPERPEPGAGAKMIQNGYSSSHLQAMPPNLEIRCHQLGHIISPKGILEKHGEPRLQPSFGSRAPRTHLDNLQETTLVWSLPQMCHCTFYHDFLGALGDRDGIKMGRLNHTRRYLYTKWLWKTVFGRLGLYMYIYIHTHVVHI